MTLPWRSNTTEPISSESDSRYETPGGAQEKVEQGIRNLPEKSVGAKQLDPALLEHYADIAINGKFQLVDEQLAETTDQLAGAGLNILNYRLPSDPDNTLMFERAFAASKSWVLPAGSFTVSDSLLWKSGIILRGIPGKTKIYFTKASDVLIKGYGYYYSGTDFGGCILEGIDFHGLGKGYGQTAGVLQSYMGRIKDCKFFDFERALKVSGVIFDFEKNEFWNNGKGVSIQDNFLGGSANFNTLLNFEGNRFYFNDLGMCNRGDGQTYRSGHENVIDFNAYGNVFESNTKAHDLWVFYGSLKRNWYEKNTDRPNLCMNNLVLDNNRFEFNANNQNYLPIVTDDGHTGVVDIPSTGGGLISVNRLRLQRYSGGANIAKRSMYELEMSAKQVYNIKDDDTTFSRAVSEINYTRTAGNASDILNKTSFLVIKETGAILTNAIDPAFTGLSVSKLGVGRYKITLRDTGVINGLVLLSVMSPDSEGHDSNTNMYHGMCRVRNTFGNSEYSSFNTFNVIYVDTYNKTASGDTLADARIHLIIHHG